MVNFAITAQESVLLFEPQAGDPDKKWLGVWHQYEIERIQL